MDRLSEGNDYATSVPAAETSAAAVVTALRSRALATIERVPGRGGSLILLSLPVLAIIVLGWTHRWISDDGWINMRVLQQWQAGHGFVFNAGERVEVGTSTLWLWVLGGTQALTGIAPNHLAVCYGIAFMAGAFVLATVAAGRLARTGERPTRALMPLGAIVWACLPPMWDFTTSGLETSLTVFWMALSFHLLVSRLGRPNHRSEGAYWPLWPALVIGLGWLVRPDAGLYAAFFALALLLQSRLGVRSWLGALALALPIPLGYQIFRMGYYATLVPNTALAKNAGDANLTAGLYYLGDFVWLYGMWVPVVIGLAVLAGRLIDAYHLKDVGRLAILVAPVIAGLAHTAYVVRVGGDFMHARFLLVPVFAMLMPVACIRLPREGRHAFIGATALILGWAMVVSTGARTRYDSIDVVGEHSGRPTSGGIANEREFWTNASPFHRTVKLEDWRGTSVAQAGLLARWDAERGRSYYAEDADEPPVAASDDRVTFAYFNMGVSAMFAGPDVRVADRLALADAVTARTVAEPITVSAQRPGHHRRDKSWRIARYAAPSPDDSAHVIDARHALRCGDLALLQASITEPLTQDLFWQNVRNSVRLTKLSFPQDPTQARAQLCGWTPTPER